MVEKSLESKLINIKNALLLQEKKASAQRVQEELAKENIKMSLNAIRAAYVTIGCPLSDSKLDTRTIKPAIKKTRDMNFKVSEEIKEYIPRDEEFIGYIERELDKRLETHYMANKYPITQGAQGTGKTLSHMYFAWKNKLPFFLFSCYEDFNLVQLFGDKTIKSGSIAFQESLFIKAIQSPSVVLFDEINAMSNANTYDFHAFLQNRKLYVKDANDGAGKVYDVHPDCFIGFAQNPRSGKYMGGNIKSSAFLGRCTYISYPEFTEEEIASLMVKRFPNVHPAELKEFIKFYKLCAESIAANSLQIDISIRQLINIVDLWMHGMDLSNALHDGLISVFDSISQPAVKESFKTLAAGTWKALMDLRTAAEETVQTEAATTEEAEIVTATATVKMPPEVTATATVKMPPEVIQLNAESPVVKIGDTIIFQGGPSGIVRHIGPLNGAGNKYSVWSEWDQQFDGEIKSASNGGTLRYKTIKMGVTYYVR